MQSSASRLECNDLLQFLRFFLLFSFRVAGYVYIIVFLKKAAALNIEMGSGETEKKEKKEEEGNRLERWESRA